MLTAEINVNEALDRRADVRRSVAAQPAANRATGASGDAVQTVFHQFAALIHFVCLLCKAGWLTRHWIGAKRESMSRSCCMEQPGQIGRR
jgi:hypothetical protein